MRLITTLLVAAAAAACSPLPKVSLDAGPADMEMLAGQWSGEYSSPALGRRGTIEFKLVAAEGQAYGNVVMIPQNANHPYEPTTLAHRDAADMAASSQMLTIRFVRASSGEITGALDPYWDPDRNCNAQSTFHGYVAKGVIEGTFTTHFDCGSGEASGRWQVTRKTSNARGTS